MSDSYDGARARVAGVTEHLERAAFFARLEG